MVNGPTPVAHSPPEGLGGTWRQGRRRGGGAAVFRFRLLHEPAQAAIGEHFAAGLARRAVGHLVRVVRHPPQVVAAPRTRLPRLSVDDPVVADLGWEAARALALDL